MPLPLPVYENILNQPQAIASVLQNQLQHGRQPLKKAARAILGARQVAVVAIGASYSASFPFIYQLAKLGIHAVLEDAAELLHYKLHLYDRDTACILISRSGDTIEIVKLIDKLKGQGVTIIGVTNVPDSALGRKSDILLTLHSPADELIAIQTWAATILTLNLLFAEMTGQLDKVTYRKQVDEAVEAVAKTCEQYQTTSSEWRFLFHEHHSIYLLARGASQASACEGQLLFHEMAWCPANFYSAGNFRHGPWEVVEKGFTGFVFAPRDPCHALNIGLAADIGRKQGQTILLTPDVPAQPLPNTVICQLPHLPPPFSPLVEIIPVQFFVYEYACWKGHQPGEFRASTPITLTEGEMAVASL
jgi:glucosamine--fructose-6-phosphate aminotransferase (isomerizing)